MARKYVVAASVVAVVSEPAVVMRTQLSRNSIGVKVCVDGVSGKEVLDVSARVVTHMLFAAFKHRLYEVGSVSTQTKSLLQAFLSRLLARSALGSEILRYEKHEVQRC